MLLLPQRAPPSQHSQMQMLDDWTGTSGDDGRMSSSVAAKRRHVSSEESVDASEEEAIVTRAMAVSGASRLVFSLFKWTI